MRHIIRLLTRRHLQKFLLLLVLDTILFSTTNARNVVSPLLVVGFILLLATVYQLFYELLAIGKFYGFKLHHQKRLALSLTGIVGCLIALQSVGELSPRDALVLIPIGLIVYLYSSYGANRPGQML